MRSVLDRMVRFLVLRLFSVSLVALCAAATHGQSLDYFRSRVSTRGLAAGADGNLWFPTEEGLAKMTTGGQVTTFPATLEGGAGAIVAGPDGRIWFTQGVAGNGWIAAITPSGEFTKYPLPPSTMAYGIASGSDGRLWFGAVGAIGSITTAGDVTLFPLPAIPPGGPIVTDLEVGPDGNVWFLEGPANRVGRMTPDGVFSHIETSPAVCCGGPVSITRGNDGGLWLAFLQQGAIARLSTAGELTVFHPLGTDQLVHVIAPGPDATIWFGSHAMGPGAKRRIGRIRLDGTVETFELPSEFQLVLDLTAGPDGNIWATLMPEGEGCTLDCPPPDPVPPFSIARLNLQASAHLSNVPALSAALLVLLGAILAVLALVMLRGASSGT